MFLSKKKSLAKEVKGAKQKCARKTHGYGHGHGQIQGCLLEDLAS